MKYMVSDRDRDKPFGICTEEVLMRMFFDFVQEFVYLRTLVICDNNVSREVERRLRIGFSADYEINLGFSTWSCCLRWYHRI